MLLNIIYGIFALAIATLVLIGIKKRSKPSRNKVDITDKTKNYEYGNMFYAELSFPNNPEIPNRVLSRNRQYHIGEEKDCDIYIPGCNVILNYRDGWYLQRYSNSNIPIEILELDSVKNQFLLGNTVGILKILQNRKSKTKTY